MAADLDFLAYGRDPRPAAFSFPGMLDPSWRDIAVDLAFLQRRKVGVGAIAGVRRQLRRGGRPSGVAT